MRVEVLKWNKFSVRYSYIIWFSWVGKWESGILLSSCTQLNWRVRSFELPVLYLTTWNAGNNMLRHMRAVSTYAWRLNAKVLLRNLNFWICHWWWGKHNTRYDVSILVYCAIINLRNDRRVGIVFFLIKGASASGTLFLHTKCIRVGIIDLV